MLRISRIRAFSVAAARPLTVGRRRAGSVDGVDRGILIPMGHDALYPSGPSARIPQKDLTNGLAYVFALNRHASIAPFQRRISNNFSRPSACKVSNAFLGHCLHDISDRDQRMGVAITLDHRRKGHRSTPRQPGSNPGPRSPQRRGKVHVRQPRGCRCRE